MELLRLELLQQHVGTLGLRNEVRRMQVLTEREAGRQPLDVREQVLGVENADDHVDRALVHRHARVQVLPQPRQDLGRCHLDVEADHIGPRHHDRADGCVLELEHLVDHLPLFALDHALAGAHVDEGPQLFLGQHRLVDALAPDEPYGQVGQPGEHRPDRPEEHAEPRHRPAGQRQEPLGVLHGEGHREHLAERGEDEDQHHDLDDQPPAVAQEVVGDRRGERGGADVDDGDPDQQRDEQIVRAPEARLRRLALRGDPLEPRAPEREVRRLGAGEDGRTDDEHGEQPEPQQDAVRHARAPSRSARTPGPPARPPRRRRGSGCPPRRRRLRRWR